MFSRVILYFICFNSITVDFVVLVSYRYAVTETCLAFTVFREDFNATFVAMFIMLLFFKGFHWLTEDRVDYVSSGHVHILSTLSCKRLLHPFAPSNIVFVPNFPSLLYDFTRWSAILVWHILFMNNIGLRRLSMGFDGF